jgi:hypothetical protein
MATTYCTVADVSDFLRIPISATTSPTKAQVEKIINRKEEYLDRRIGHTFGRNKTIEKEKHDLALDGVFQFTYNIEIAENLIIQQETELKFGRVLHQLTET